MRGNAKLLVIFVGSALLSLTSPVSAAPCGPAERQKMIDLIDFRTQRSKLRIIKEKNFKQFGQKVFNLQMASLDTIEGMISAIREGRGSKLRRNMKLYHVVDQAFSSWGRDIVLDGITSVGPASGNEGIIGSAIGRSITNGRFDTYLGCWLVYGKTTVIFTGGCNQKILQFMKSNEPSSSRNVCEVFRELVVY